MALVVKSFVPKEVDIQIPKCVVESREEWTCEDNFDAKIEELFERGGSEDVLTPREIGEHAQECCEDAKDFNKNLIGRTLRALGYIRDRKPRYIKRLGKTDRCYLNIKNLWNNGPSSLFGKMQTASSVLSHLFVLSPLEFLTRQNYVFVDCVVAERKSR